MKIRFALYFSLFIGLMLIGCKTTGNSADNSQDTGAVENTEKPEKPEKVAKATYMTKEERKMIDEINLMRSNPPGYVQYIEKYLEDFKSSGWGGDQIAQEEATGQELIKELKKLKPLSILQPHEELYNVCMVHGKDALQKGSLDHNDSNGRSPYDRIISNTELTDGTENLAGGMNTVRKTVIMLLVDSGIPNRGHRRALLNPLWTYAACHMVGEVGGMPHSWIQMFGTK